MEKRNCQNCQGDQIEAICVNLDNNTTLQEFVDTTEESLEKEIIESYKIVKNSAFSCAV